MANSAVGYGTGRWRLVRMLSVMVVGVLCLAVLHGRLGGVDMAAVRSAVLAVAPHQWLASVCLVALSFHAVAGQEMALHRHFATRAPLAPARRAGMAAAAIGQVVGFGPAIGALIRWRMVPGLGAWQAARISLGLSVAFLLAMVLAWSLASMAAPGQPPPGPAIAAGLAILGLIALCAASPRWLTRHVRLPSLACLFAFLGWAMLDIAALAAALWTVLPPEIDLPYLAFLPVFILALAAGLASGAPGGVGAFDLSLMALLPGVEPATLLASVLAFRLTGLVIPGVLGGLAALVSAPKTAPVPGGSDGQRAPRASLMPRAEAQVVRQGQLRLEGVRGQAVWVLGRLPQTCVALGDPGLGRECDARTKALASLVSTARTEGRLPCLYKTGARMAVAARHAGWIARPVADEAWLRPDRFSLSGPSRAVLRRKLRRAGNAGVDVQAAAALPLKEMAEVAQAWARVHRGERGFSMGRWCPDYVRDQRVFLARHDGRLVGFITLHAGLSEWTLDLMRHLPDCPDGTMHALVTASIDAARDAGIPRLSLAAVPRLAQRPPTGRRTAAGLARFKAAFAPQWEPLYICAPSRIALLIAAADIARAILHPVPLASRPLRNHPSAIGFALGAVPWHSTEALAPGDPVILPYEEQT